MISTGQGRILLVDDDHEWLEELYETLQDANFYVEVAATPEEARQKLAHTLFHIVVLDIRMEAADQTNKEGITLLREFKRSQPGKETKVIMLSAYNTLPDMRAAFKEEVVDVLNKLEFDNTDFVQSITEIFTKHPKINLELEIAWQHGSSPNKVVQGLELGNACIEKNSVQLDATAFELVDLLCRLFWDAKSILVNQLTSGYSGSRILSVQPVHSDGAARMVVVKFGAMDQIDSEYDKFKKYAEPYIGGGRNTRTLTVRHTLLLGGIVYSLLGAADDRQRNFGEFYRTATVKQIKEMLDGLFKKTCAAWYASPGKQVLLDLSKIYPQNLNFTWEKLYSMLSGSLKSVQVTEKLTFDALSNSHKFTNPIVVTEERHTFYTTYMSITHGDFNQNNIFVDSNGHSWLIDFQKTGPGHILRDFVALDTEIRCKLLRPEDATLAERLMLEQTLCSINKFQQLSQLANPFRTQNPALAKTFDVILYLRTLAYSLIPHNQDDDMTEYYTALLYQALNTSRFRTLPTGQREHALLSASLLADKLNLGG